MVYCATGPFVAVSTKNPLAGWPGFDVSIRWSGASSRKPWAGELDGDGDGAGDVGAVGGEAGGVWCPGGAAGLDTPADTGARGVGRAVAAGDLDGAGPELAGPVLAGTALEDGAGTPAPSPAPAARGRCEPPPAVTMAVIAAEAASAASMAAARTNPECRGVCLHQPSFMGPTVVRTGAGPGQNGMPDIRPT
jgi:hypothetical protein